MYISPRADSSASVYDSVKANKRSSTQPVVYLPESGQVAHLLSTSQVPKSVVPDGKMLILSNNTAVCFFKCVFECVTLFVLSDSVLLC